MNRILCIVGSMGTGGAETFLMKIYRAIDKTKYQMDFCVTKPDCFDGEIKNMGGRIFFYPPKTKRPIKSFRSIKLIVKQNKYTSVIRVSQNSLSSLELLAAKMGGAIRLIYRSSNSNSCGSFFETLIHYLFRPVSLLFSNVKIAPSIPAAKFMFGNGCIKKKKAHILKNGIDTLFYSFNDNKRKQARNIFNVTDEFVVGHVGRFNYQKNHAFLIDIFFEIIKINPKSKLILIGTGELEEQIRKKINHLGLSDYVIILGERKDVNILLSGFDVFVFPSLFEGMPNTVIEAQCSGLPCFISDSITSEAKITDLVSFCSYRQSADEWAKAILSREPVYNRGDYSKVLDKCGYNIKDCVSNFVSFCFGPEKKAGN